MQQPAQVAPAAPAPVQTQPAQVSRPAVTEKTPFGKRRVAGALTPPPVPAAPAAPVPQAPATAPAVPQAQAPRQAVPKAQPKATGRVGAIAAGALAAGKALKPKAAPKAAPKPAPEPGSREAIQQWAAKRQSSLEDLRKTDKYKTTFQTHMDQMKGNKKLDEAQKRKLAQKFADRDLGHK